LNLIGLFLSVVLNVTSGVINLQFGLRIILQVLHIIILFTFRFLQLIDISSILCAEYHQDRDSGKVI